MSVVSVEQMNNGGTLHQGDTGTAVTQLKKYLNTAGYTVSSSGNSYDATTVNKVKSFQNDYGAIVDGIVGNKSWMLLKKFYDSYTMQIYQEKLDYDLIFNLHMVKDDIIYVLTIPFDSWHDKKFYPFTKTKVEGNYEGEKILNVYNDRIIRTDKAFYEVVDYYKDSKKTTTTC